MSMNPVFQANITDEYGDMWSSAVVRVDDVQIYNSAVSGLRVNEDDSYSRYSVDDETQSEPYKITYSVEFWSKLLNKAEGKRSRELSVDGSKVFEVDFNTESVIEQWAQMNFDYDTKLVAICMWHFKNFVV